MSDRGMKKWAPYKSLPEQEKNLSKVRSNKKKKTKPQISNEIAEEINNILINYHGEQVTITYFTEDKHTITSTINKIDNVNKKLILSDNTIISFNELLYIFK